MLLQISTIFFLFILFILFYVSPSAFRKYILLLGSIVFIYFEGGLFGLFFLLVISFITWITGLFFSDKARSKGAQKAVTVIFCAVIAGILFGWKYIPWGMQQLGMDTTFWQEHAMPIGLSFYSFQAISYIADLYGRRTDTVKNPVTLLLYMMWFPKWMSGPIERAGDFVERINKSGKVRLPDAERFLNVAIYIVLGLFMKVVIADRVAIVVDTVFTDLTIYGPLTMMLASLLYTIQIYCDFAGYTNMMIGVSLIFGIELTQNFNTPYMSQNIVEFWRRWHISLSSFLRDYIYIPLGGNRRGEGRKLLNTLVVFFVCGLWHGAGLSFMIWGLFHGVISIITNVLKKTKASFLFRGAVGRIITFCMVSFAWIFFRAASISEAVIFIKNMFIGLNANALFAGFAETEGLILGITRIEWCIAVIGILLLTLLDYLAYRKDCSQSEAVKNFGDVTKMILLTAGTIVILIFGVYGSGEEIRSFVYMNF